MVAAATTAAAAPEVVLDWTVGSDDVVRQLGYPNQPTLSFDGSGADQWLRVRIDAAGLNSNFFLSTYPDGGDVGEYELRLHLSTNPGEDGSTLDPGGGVFVTRSPRTLGGYPDTHAPPYGVTGAWLYIQYTPQAPFQVEPARVGIQLVTQLVTFTGSTLHAPGGDVALGATTVRIHSPEEIDGAPEEAAGRTTVTVAVAHTSVADLDVAAGSTTVLIRLPVTAIPDRVVGATTVALGAVAAYVPDEAAGSTTVTVAGTGRVVGVPDVAAGLTFVRVVYFPDMSDNVPISLAMDAVAEIVLIAPGGTDPDDGISYGDSMLYAGPAPKAWSQRRAVGLVTASMPNPLVVDGSPTVPLYWGASGSVGIAVEGPSHIHATDPAPVWNPTTGGWTSPPPPGTPAWDGRWVVDDLPDPPDGGFYWLGAGSSQDGTEDISASRSSWRPHASTPSAPSWNSFFPFKPSVHAHDSYLPGGDVVHYPKGVAFNSHFIEHMWLDWGGSRRQPFTWVIAAMVDGFPSTHYRHYLLDAGRNPDHTGMRRLSAADCNNPRTINDDLAYRNLIAYSRDSEIMCARNDIHTARTVSARVDNNIRPKMFYGVFNGATSTVGAHGPNSRKSTTGRIDNGAPQEHRYYVLGRSQGFLSQDLASHLLVFEIRFWSTALTSTQLDAQYDQLSSTYQFDRYRGV